MKRSSTSATGVWPRLLLALALGACGTDDLVTSPPSTSSTVPSSSSQFASPSISLVLAAYTGIPYGASDLLKSNGTVLWGPGPFTSSNNYTEPGTLINQLNLAKGTGQKLILNMTGGSHDRYKTNGKFDLAKWEAVMNTYDTPQIKAAVAAAVADGTIIMNSVMDEPSVTDWGGVMTKPLLDQMASYVKNLFPTLPVGVVNRSDWRLDEKYEVMDAILAQYQWNKGSVTAYRDYVLAEAQRQGMSVVFSLNLLNGGIINWTTRDCPIPLTGGFGTYSPGCRMTANQVRDWGRLLGVAGCAMNMWRYDQAFMADTANQQAFRDVAATLATVPGTPCRRTSPGGAPPSNLKPTAAFTVPNCTVGLACQFTDGSSDPDGIIASRSWDFGGGITSSATNPSTTFGAAGTVSVTLVVTDDDGATDAVTQDVTVSPAGNLAPTAGFSPLRCTVDVACKFTDSSTDPDGRIDSRSWDFGNGETSSATNPTTTYSTEGTYSVSLTVTDNDGETGSITQSVTASSAPNSPPTAAFIAPDCTVGVVCQFHDGSSDSDGVIAARSWNFGNGTQSSVANPSPTFASAGSYDVTLTVTDDAGDTDAVTLAVIVGTAPNLPPTASFSVPSCAAGVGCQFTDGSSDTDGTIASRSWQFGNGMTSTVASPSITYSAAGSYSVTLTVTDDAGSTDAMTKTVSVSPAPNLPPVAAFTAPSCTAGAACKFTDASSDPDGSIAGRSWQFGNGMTSTAASPSITYSAAGSYSVKLTVTDDDGTANSVTKTVTVGSAANLPPAAAFTLPSCTAGATCRFTDASSDPDGSIASRSWQFGNGMTSTAASPSITYAAAGTYSVVLKVTDNRGSSASVTKSLTVGSSLPSPSPITLTLTGSIQNNRQSVLLTWTGLSGASADIYRDGVVLLTTANDGRENTLIPLQGNASYTYKVCEAGKTRCSPTVTFKLPSILLNVTATMKEVDLQAMTLLWAGASGTTMKVYRNGVLITSTANTGRYTNTRRFVGAATYIFKVCEATTNKCSNTATATFP